MEGARRLGRRKPVLKLWPSEVGLSERSPHLPPGSLPGFVPQTCYHIFSWECFLHLPPGDGECRDQAGPPCRWDQLMKRVGWGGQLSHHIGVGDPGPSRWVWLPSPPRKLSYQSCWTRLTQEGWVQSWVSLQCPFSEASTMDTPQALPLFLLLGKFPAQSPPLQSP